MCISTLTHPPTPPQCNEVDRLTQELRHWQEDCRASKEAYSQANSRLQEVQRQADAFLACQQNYEHLVVQHSELKKEVS